ncbi:MAG: hypothetical protein KJ779_02815 [Firmicutes bacterium]|nr:hypothetical protein [Bacillota bacterium]
MSFKLNVVEIRTFLFEVDADNYENAYALLKEEISEMNDPSATVHEDIRCVDDSGIIQLISSNEPASVSELPSLSETIEVCKTSDQSANENTPKLTVRFYDWRCILLLEQTNQDPSRRIWDLSYEPYIEYQKKQDVTRRDVLDQIKNDVNTFCSRSLRCDQPIVSTMINVVAEMIFKVIERTTATGDIAADLSSLFFDGHFILFMHDKYVTVGLKDIYYQGYLDLQADQNLDEDDILGIVMNDILDFVSQFDGTDDLINAVKLKKITDIMEIIKFQLFH